MITANIEERDLAAVSRDILAIAVERLERPQGYFFELGGQNRELETSYSPASNSRWRWPYSWCTW